MKKITIKSSCNYTLQTYSFYIKSILKKLNVRHSIFSLPKTEQKFTLLKSPHVFKKAKEQFKVSKYKTIISVDMEKDLFYQNILPLLINKPKSLVIKINS